MSANPALPPAAGSIHQLVLLYTPAANRPALQCLFAVQGEIRASLRAGLDHSVAHARLSWWQAECERALADNASHPLMRGIGNPAPDLRGLVQAAALDLAQAPLEDELALRVYCDAAQGTLFAAVATLLGTGAIEARGLGTSLHVLEWQCASSAQSIEVPAAEAALSAQLQILQPAQRMQLRSLLVWVALSRWRMAHAIHQPARAPLPTLRLTMLQNLLAWRVARAANQGRYPHPPTQE